MIRDLLVDVAILGFVIAVWFAMMAAMVLGAYAMAWNF